MSESPKFRFKINTLIAGAQSRQMVENPTPPAMWSVDDVESLLNLMCSFVRPDGARFVYAFTPAQDDRGVVGAVITVTVGEDAAMTEVLPIQEAVAEEMVRRSVVPFVPDARASKGQPS